MAVTQIIGPRIAPYWADPAEWTSTRAYEPFTFVTYQGDSYCSRQDTPIGIDITNDDYWVKVSDYNAQAVALQRSMTQTIETAETNMADAIQTGKNDIAKAINDAEASMQQSVADVNTVKNEYQSSLNSLNEIVPFDSKPVANSNKGVTSGGLYPMASKKVMLVIGDSFSDIDFLTQSPRKLWCNTVADRLNLELHNYAKGGSGYLAVGLDGTTTFPIEVNRAIADTSFDHNLVTKIVMFGGLNDIRQQKTGTYAGTFFLNNIIPQVNRLHNEFTHATIYLGFDTAPVMEAYNYGSTRLLEQIAFSYYYGPSRNPYYIPVMLTDIWWANSTALFSNNRAGHPNQVGHDLMAERMISYMTGGGWFPCRPPYGIFQAYNQKSIYTTFFDSIEVFNDSITYQETTPWLTEGGATTEDGALGIHQRIYMEFKENDFILRALLAPYGIAQQTTFARFRCKPKDGFFPTTDNRNTMFFKGSMAYATTQGGVSSADVPHGAQLWNPALYCTFVSQATVNATNDRHGMQLEIHL